VTHGDSALESTADAPDDIEAAAEKLRSNYGERAS
jgi:hypothetical protein